MHYMEIMTKRWDTRAHEMDITELGKVLRIILLAILSSRILGLPLFGKIIAVLWLVLVICVPVMIVPRKRFDCQTRNLTHKDKITWKVVWDKALAFVHIRTFQRPTSQLYIVDDKYTLQHQELCILYGIYRERGTMMMCIPITVAFVAFE